MKKGIFVVLVLLNSFWLKANDTAFYATMVQDSFTVPVHYNNSVKYKITTTLSSAWKTTKVLEKYSQYKASIEEAFLTNDLPVELSIMALSNTSFDPLYVDKIDGAVGVWPLSFSMAKRYDLHINSYIDQRRSVELSTQAAIRFLKELYAIYGDWRLVVPAFKVGAIKVNFAMRKANNQTEFEKVYPFMDYESKQALEKYMAWLYVHKHHKLKLKEISLDSFDTLFVKEDISIELFSTYTGITEQKIKEMNPVIKRDVIPGKLSPFYLNVPAGKKDSIKMIVPFLADSTKNAKIKVVKVVAPAAQGSGSSTGYRTIYYKVKSGDNLGLIADCYDVFISDIKRWNGIRGTTIYAGKNLKIKVKASKYAKYKAVNGYSMSKKKAVARKD
jgi:membrane-bound lytic murein transglycosylase D